MSTTKLTRKEISADPIHDALINAVELFHSRSKLILMVGIGFVVLLLGGYFLMNYLNSRDNAIQQELAKGIEYFHGLTDPSAKDDPYALGPTPVFKNDEIRYRSASSIFEAVAKRQGNGKLGIIARYYLGLCQKQMGQKEEAKATLEAVANNTAERTVGNLARKVLASYCVESGDAQKGQEMLQGMLKDTQCDLPKEDLQIDLSRALMAQGKREEAIKILQEAQESSGGGTIQSLVFQELNRIQLNSGK